MAGRVGARPFVAQVELRRRVVSDVLLTLLNAPVTTDPRSPRYIPRRLLAPPPNEIALWWDEPTIAFDDPTHILFSARLAGDMRQPGSGRIFAVSGPLRARLRLDALSDTWRAPYLGLTVDTLDLSGLVVSYAGAAVNASATTMGLDVRAANAPLWRLINEQLITPLAQLPFSLVWSALADWQAQGLRLGAATARAVDAETVALTFASHDAAPNSRPLSAAAASNAATATYLDDDTGDFALTFSAEGATQLALHLLATGALPRRLPDAAPPHADPNTVGQTTVEELAITLRAGVISMLAHLRHDDGRDPRDASVVLDFTCALDPNGALVVTPTDAQAGFLMADDDQRQDARLAAAADALSAAAHTLAAAFARELPGVFGQRQTANSAEYPQLPQVAAIPSTSLTLAITPTRVVVGEGALTFVGVTPASGARFVAQPLERAPGVSDLPTLPGLSLLTPYDPALTNYYADDDAPSSAIVPAIPAGAAQVWRAGEPPARLAPAPQRSRRRSRLLLALLALALVVTALSGYLALSRAPSSGMGTLGLGHGAAFGQSAANATATQAASSGGAAPTASPPGAPGATTTPAPGATSSPGPGATPTATVPAASTPTPTLAPGETPTPPAVNPSLGVINTSNSQGCVVALLPPTAFTLTLTNDAANPATWQITITQPDSSGTQPWATASAPTGSLAPGASTTITITPTAASCPGVLGSDTYFLTVVASNQDGSGQPETVQVNDVISDV